MNIILLGHDDIASKIALRLIVAGLREHDFRLFLSGSLDSALKPLPPVLVDLARLDSSLYDHLPWDIGCEVRDLPAPNSAEGLKVLRSCDPDLFISVRFRRILEPGAIGIPRHGVLNLHSGLLPAYKGVMATFWAMLNGEDEIGCTLHWILDGKIDTGPVIGQSKMSTRTDWSYLANVLELYPAGCRMVIDAVNRISAGEPVGSSEQTGKGHYYSTPQIADLDRFEANGLQLADAGDLDEFLARHEEIV
jgi:methionyl-tRNA formyltransferase